MASTHEAYREAVTLALTIKGPAEQRLEALLAEEGQPDRATKERMAKLDDAATHEHQVAISFLTRGNPLQEEPSAHLGVHTGDDLETRTEYVLIRRSYSAAGMKGEDATAQPNLFFKSLDAALAELPPRAEGRATGAA